MKSIAFFNNKGGVSKTTTVLNIAYMIAKNIQDDEKHPLNILGHMIFQIKENLIGKEYTMEELKLIQAKFEFARDYANEVIKNNE